MKRKPHDRRKKTAGKAGKGSKPRPVCQECGDDDCIAWYDDDQTGKTLPFCLDCLEILYPGTDAK